LTRATLFQLSVGTALVIGLATAAILRGPEPSASPVAHQPDPVPPPVEPVLRAPAPPVVTAIAAATARAAPPAVSDASAVVDEPSLMAELRSIKGSDPERAIRLAEQGNQRFPDSADAPERASIRIHALSDEGQHSEARRSAEDMVNHYPDSPWVRDVEVLTGAHRHRSIRLNAQGGLETY
jgi:hypothetical protein